MDFKENRVYRRVIKEEKHDTIMLQYQTIKLIDFQG